MRSLGRFSSRYDNLPSPKISEQVISTINPDTPLIDLAATDLGRVRISCRLEHENLSWGRHEGIPAAIIPVQIKAERPPDCKLTDFSIDLQLLPARHAACLQDVSQHEDVSVNSVSKSVPHLIKAPSPEQVAGRSLAPSNPSLATAASTATPGELERRSTYAYKSWYFRGGCIADHMDRPVTARWTYEASPAAPGERDQKPFHGAMALFHNDQEFEVKCSVVGNATQSRLRYRFGGQNSQPRFWKIQPQSREDDLKIMVDNLESRMVLLNILRSVRENHDAVDFGAVSARLNATLTRRKSDQPEAVRFDHELGPSNTSRSATVFMGDISVNCA